MNDSTKKYLSLKLQSKGDISSEIVIRYKRKAIQCAFNAAILCYTLSTLSILVN